MTAYYNEIDPYAAKWLRQLIAAGHIAPGEVDERSIVDVRPDDLRGFDQVHLFAGIGGWSLALRLAGWPDDRPAWTGSCPCQPFSIAGKQRAESDERHLWPEMRRLVAECRPPVVFGEQVASRLGRDWLAGVRSDVEALGYAVGAADLCAAGVGAPHIRQRLWWVGVSNSAGRDAWRSPAKAVGYGRAVVAASGAGGMADASDPERRPGIGYPEAGTWPDGLGRRRSGVGSSWGNAVWIPCADGKARRIEPSIQPLAHGLPARVGRLRAYGNAIVPQVAAAFIRAALDTATGTV